MTQPNYSLDSINFDISNFDISDIQEYLDQHLIKPGKPIFSKDGATELQQYYNIAATTKNHTDNTKYQVALNYETKEVIFKGITSYKFSARFNIFSAIRSFIKVFNPPLTRIDVCCDFIKSTEANKTSLSDDDVSISIKQPRPSAPPSLEALKLTRKDTNLNTAYYKNISGVSNYELACQVITYDRSIKLYDISKEDLTKGKTSILAPFDVIRLEIQLKNQQLLQELGIITLQDVSKNIKAPVEYILQQLEIKIDDEVVQLRPFSCPDKNRDFYGIINYLIGKRKTLPESVQLLDTKIYEELAIIKGIEKKKSSISIAKEVFVHRNRISYQKKRFVEIANRVAYINSNDKVIQQMLTRV